MTIDLAAPWPAPKRILLLTYNRLDHMGASYAHMVVGIPGDRGSITKAKRIRRDDWVMIRISEVQEFIATRPARVIGAPLRQNARRPYPDLLWNEEIEQKRIVYPFRIPVLWVGGPSTRPGCINWEALAALGLKGKDHFRLDTPQQWGIKFSCNVLEDPP